MHGMIGAAIRSVGLGMIGVGAMGAAQTADVPLPTGPLMAFDIAGVRLGTSAAEAGSVLRRNGYAVAPQQSYSYVQSFEQGVRQEADRRLGRTGPMSKWASVSKLDADGPHRERVHIDMAQSPSGPIVSSVAFEVPQESMTRDAFKTQVLAKYGAPQRIVAGDEGKWCSPEAAAFCGQALANAGRYDSDYPMLTTSLMGRSLHLTIGEDEARRLDRARELAVQALAPKTSRAAF